MRLSLVLGMVLVAACTSATPAPTTTQAAPPGAVTPEEAVGAWLEGLAGADYQATALVVPDRQVALLAATEGEDPALVVELLEAGVPPSVRRNFWQSFADGLSSFSGVEPTGLVVDERERFDVEERSFAVVSLVVEERLGSGEVITIEDAGGRWWVDLFASFGSAFARPLRSWMGRLEGSGSADEARAALRAERTSLMAALSRNQPPGSQELRFLVIELE